MNQCLKISIMRGGCRFATPLYLGSSYVLSFEGDRSDEASRVVFVNPLSKDSADIDGIVVLAESIVVDEETILSLNRNALVEWFKSNSAFGVESTVDAHCYVFNDKGDVLADSPVTIEYSPTLFVVDSNDYPLAKEVLLQAISAKNQAIEAKDSAISAKDSAVSAKSAAENAMLAAENAKKITQEASSVAEEAATTSSDARDDAISARNSAYDAKDAAKEYASTVETALGKMIASAKKVVGGVEVLLWNGQGNKPVPIFIPNGIDGVTGYVRCDEDGKYYCLKCKEVDGEKVIVLVQTGVDSINQEGYVRAVNGNTPDETGNVNVPIDFLPLSGGTINGTIIKSGGETALKKDTDSSVVQIIGGIDSEKNAYINLYGKNYPEDTYKGAFLLVANNGTNIVKLIGLPNGKLIWNGKNVTLAGDCLPLSGGNMNGIITFAIKSGIIKKYDSTGQVVICGGANYTNGAALYLHGKDYSDSTTVEGAFAILAHNGTDSSYLKGTPSGSLTWGGKAVTLAGDCLPLSGGDMKGSIAFTTVNGSIVNKNESGRICIYSGSSYYDGATIILYSINYAVDDYHKGIFSISAKDDTNEKTLTGKPDGTLTWDKSPVFLPTGSVFAFAANTIPAGCLICNGAAVSRTTYAKLFAVIGTTYGSGDGSTTFNLPNLTDRFIQGSGTAGTVKEAGLPDHTHTTVLGLGGTWDNSYGGSKKVAGADYDSSHNAKPDLTNASKSNSIYGKSNTVQPPALTMRYYIKY